MTETESIPVATVSDGPCGHRQPGRTVELPVVELLTGRGFVTGKSGAGKSNTASVVVEKLLDNGFGMLIVDVDGEYYGLKEEYEILHVGADDECDVQVTVDHAERIASLALEQNVPIILDMSSFLDEEEGQELLTAVARQLFAKEKKQKQPFLMLVEEVHEYVPQQGSVGECGRMLIKISKRGRKHGLGILGVSQRPADVKKDFITQCDWLVWHRLTWDNDTKVVRRVLDGSYAEAVEDLDDGEAFMTTDWSESVERVQFHRKRTFDAGATPGLDDFERPDLKSVSDDLVSELQAISDEQRERETRVAELREELDAKNSRIAELEAELRDARDLQRMAEQFTRALVEHVDGANPGRTEQERIRSGRAWADERDRSRADAGGRDRTDPASADLESESGSAAGGGLFGDFDPSAFADDGASGSDDTASRVSPGGPTGSADGGADASAATDGGSVAAGVTRGFDGVEENPLGDRATDAFARGTTTAVDEGTVDDPAAFVSRLVDEIGDLRSETRAMLRYYRDHGPGTPMDALFAVGGSNDRTAAYARNRRLRVLGLVEHVGRGRYDYRVPDLLRERTDGARVDPFVERVEDAVGEATELDESGTAGEGGRTDDAHLGGSGRSSGAVDDGTRRSRNVDDGTRQPRNVDDDGSGTADFDGSGIDFID